MALLYLLSFHFFEGHSPISSFKRILRTFLPYFFPTTRILTLFKMLEPLIKTFFWSLSSFIFYYFFISFSACFFFSFLHCLYYLFQADYQGLFFSILIVDILVEKKGAKKKKNSFILTYSIITYPLYYYILSLCL